MNIHFETKKLLLFLAFNCAMVMVFAQAPKLSIGLQIVSTPSYPNLGAFLNENLPSSLSGDYKISSIGYGITGILRSSKLPENWSFQFRMNYYNRDIKMKTAFLVYDNKDAGPVGLESYDFSYKQFNLLLAPGLRFTQKNKNMLIYGGLELPFFYIGEVEQKLVYEVLSYPRDQLYNQTGYTHIPGGYIIGLGTFAGVQYKFGKHLAIGPEVSFGVNYTHLGGLMTYDRIDNAIRPWVPQSAHVYVQNTIGISQIAFSGITGAFCISYSLY